MKFWKEHVTLRVWLMLATFVLGIALILIGWGAFDKLAAWTMSGKMTGLVIMLVGIAFLLACLALYNKPFEEPKAKKSK